MGVSEFVVKLSMSYRCQWSAKG